ncbi:RCC1 domain-containing protein 1-like [Pieris napi]|uniref:RCC1 domain-containing protein 1-like n=1 Tax=Pieris napi TaxID=78633 RepID=UPI001FBBE747|nr:RCC1 domain-containing protein 1-like [Pieris napi]
MYKVAGSNLFHQWLHEEVIFDKFKPSCKNGQPHIAEVICICWSYNLFREGDSLYISGAFQSKDNQYREIPIPEKLKNTCILTSGNDYNLILVGTGSSIVFIYNLKTYEYKSIKFIEAMNVDVQIVKVVMTNNNCIYLSNQGDIYCGILPIHLNTGHCNGKIVDVVLGNEHAILLTDTGQIYTWGNGRRLQLGHGELNNLEFPTEVKALAGIKITKISAGGWHSCALSEFGDLYVWGWNDMGQLGVKQGSENVQTFGLPTLVDIYDDDGQEIQINVIDVACGTRHTAILLEDRSIWTSGNNKYGQLGLCIQEYQKVVYFKKSYKYKTECKLKCGPWNTIIVASL